MSATIVFRRRSVTITIVVELRQVWLPGAMVARLASIAGGTTSLHPFEFSLRTFGTQRPGGRNEQTSDSSGTVTVVLERCTSYRKEKGM